MTYHPDSVLVEKVAKARFAASGPVAYDWDELAPSERSAWRMATTVWLSVACPLVAGVIADRLDEEGNELKASWDSCCVDSIKYAAVLVRSEYGERA